MANQRGSAYRRDGMEGVDGDSEIPPSESGIGQRHSICKWVLTTKVKVFRFFHCISFFRHRRCPMSIMNCATFVAYANSSNACVYVHLRARKLRAPHFRFEEPKLLLSPSQQRNAIIVLSATGVTRLKPSRRLKRPGHARDCVRRVDAGRYRTGNKSMNQSKSH